MIALVIVGIVIAWLIVQWIGSASQAVDAAVEDATGNEDAGNGCGWLFCIVVSVIVMAAWTLGAAMLMGGG
jgi:hypothetical protein